MKIKTLILFVTLLGACGKAPNKNKSVAEYDNISSNQENMLETIKRIDTIITYKNLADTISDTIIYNNNDYSVNDTAINNYHVHLKIIPDGKLLPGILGIQNGDTLTYCYRNTKLIMKVQYKDSIVLSKIMSRECFNRDLQIPHEQFSKYRISKANVMGVNGDTLNIETTLSIPDSDLFECFRLSINNKGTLSYNRVYIEYEE